MSTSTVSETAVHSIECVIATALTYTEHGLEKAGRSTEDSREAGK